MNLLKGMRIALFASVTLAMVVGFVPHSMAQNAATVDACGPSTEAAQGQPSNNGGYPFTYPADGGGVNAKKAGPPMPANPIKKVCERGAVQILMGNDQHFGYRIGDRIPVTVIIQTAPHVVIDFTSLETQRKLAFEPSDFVLYGEPKITSETLPNGAKQHVIQLAVQSFVMKADDKVIALKLDLRYSTEMTEDGKRQAWKILSTPDFVVTRSLTVDHGNELLEGDLQKKPLSLPWATYILLIAGFVSIFLVPTTIFVKWLNRQITRKSPPPERVAWEIFDEVFAQVETMGSFETEHYARIDAALRAYLEAKQGVPVVSATLLEIRDRLSHLDEFDKINMVITSCEGVIYKDETLTEDQNYEIVQNIKELVPRSWDSK